MICFFECSRDGRADKFIINAANQRKVTKYATFMTADEIDRIWADCKAREEREAAEFEALPEEEKKRRREMYDPAFIERISDDVTGGHDD